MPVEAEGAGAILAAPGTPAGRRSLRRPTRAALGHGLLVLTPAALALWLSFQSGGFFAGETAVAALLALGAVLLWAMVAERPLAGLSAAGLVAVASLALLAAWTLTSALWSGAPARAQIEFVRTLLYLATFALMAMMPGGSARALQLLRLTALVLAVAVLAGLLSRLYPGLSEAALARGAERLGWPIGYWNALGLAGVMSIVVALHLSSDLREPGWIRVAAAAAIPALAVATYLTLSRGALVAGVLGLAVLLVLGFSRGMLSALVAAVPCTALALISAHDADTLFGTPAGRQVWAAQGRELAGAVAIACAAAAVTRLAGVPVDAWLRRRRVWRPWSRARKAGLVAVVLAGVAAAGVAVDAGPALERQWKSFRETPNVRVEDPRSRLQAASANGRIEHWEVAVERWRDESPLLGSGAGTYAHAWAQLRESEFSVQDAHSLYFEVLSELGLVGLVLLGVALAVALASVWTRRGNDRLAWSAVLAVSVVWLVHAGVDWDWELPAVTLPIVALLGAGCARHVPAASRPSHDRRTIRLLAGLGILMLMITPARVAISHDNLGQALTAFRDGRCGVTIDASLQAAEALNTHPVPFELLGYCDVYRRQSALGVRMLNAAVRRDPESWELRYGLALVRGAAGVDPRREIRRARRLNPLDWRVRRAAERFDSARPAVWRREARKLPLILPSR